MNKVTVRQVLAVAFFLPLLSCDCERLSECEWFIVPEEKHAGLVKPGFVSVCLRNYETGKEKCYLDMKLEEAEEVYGKKVRYSGIKLDSSVFPRRIISYAVCGG